MFVYLSHNEIYVHACMTMYIEGGNNIYGEIGGDAILGGGGSRCDSLIIHAHYVAGIFR